MAEVLITLGIIGVVAAMTMPALINTTQKKELVAQYKKTYSVISQAYMMILNLIMTILMSLQNTLKMLRSVETMKIKNVIFILLKDLMTLWLIMTMHQL